MHDSSLDCEEELALLTLIPFQVRTALNQRDDTCSVSLGRARSISTTHHRRLFFLTLRLSSYSATSYVAPSLGPGGENGLLGELHAEPFLH